MFDVTACHVERDAQQNYRLSWGGLTPIAEVSVYISEDAEDFYRNAERGEPLVRSKWAVIPLQSRASSNSSWVGLR